jgi:hypothetical protein
LLRGDRLLEESMDILGDQLCGESVDIFGQTHYQQMLRYRQSEKENIDK